MGKTKQAAPQRMYIATESFCPAIDGVPHSIHKDTTRVWEGHELLARYPQWFKPIEAHYGTRVEAATATSSKEKYFAEDATPDMVITAASGEERE